MAEEPIVETFPWKETADRFRQFQAACEGAIHVEDRALVASEDGRRFVPPLLQPLREDEPLEDWLARAEQRDRRRLLVLVQAGASSMGYWYGDELLAHKVIKKYVVRGKGKAQPTHLKTRGKSRYGSRLRLRNASAQLVQTNEKLLAWWDEHGPADDVFLSCPKRTVPELFATEPAPPFARDAALRIPLDVHVPDFEELRAVYRRMSRGRIEIYCDPSLG